MLSWRPTTEVRLQRIVLGVMSWCACVVECKMLVVCGGCDKYCLSVHAYRTCRLLSVSCFERRKRGVKFTLS